MSVTIHDVAKLAGVSHTTVSWAIHDRPGISAATKEKVFKAIAELDYHPNLLARSLVRGKTNTIAIVAPFFSSSFEMEVLKGIEQSAPENKDQYSITLFNTMEQNDKVMKEIVHGKRADAVISLSLAPSADVVSLYTANRVPLIVIDETAPDTVEIQLNNFRGGYLAAKHLLDSGRRRIALVLGDNGDLGLSQRERKRGYEQALRESGAEIDEKLYFYIADYYFEEGQALFPRMRELMSGVDAVFFAAGDLVAMGFMLEARHAGVSIPKDLSVIGYDDIPSAGLVMPALTTVRQPLFQIGKAAYAEAIRALESGETEPRAIVYEPRLVLRESV